MSRSFKKRSKMHHVVVQVWLRKSLKNGSIVSIRDGYSIHRNFSDAYDFRADNFFIFPDLYAYGALYCAIVGDKKWNDLMRFGNLYFSKKPPSVRRCRRPKI